MQTANWHLKGNYYVEGVRIENNTISGKANGISLGDVRGATLSNNTITGCKRSGVQIADGSKVTISGGKIQKNTRNGVLVEKIQRFISKAEELKRTLSTVSM